jgi:hypothetical protein
MFSSSNAIHHGSGPAGVTQRPIHHVQFFGLHGLFPQRALRHGQKVNQKGLLHVAQIAVERVFAHRQPAGSKVKIQPVGIEQGGGRGQTMAQPIFPYGQGKATAFWRGISR